jgi:hypothetical protein
MAKGSFQRHKAGSQTTEISLIMAEMLGKEDILYTKLIHEVLFEVFYIFFLFDSNFCFFLQFFSIIK